jgi:hypothetical protein
MDADLMPNLPGTGAKDNANPNINLTAGIMENNVQFDAMQTNGVFH